MTYLSELQDEIGQINEEKGFNQAKDVPEEYRHYYYMAKLMLVVTELSEGAEEIRLGRAPDEEYLSYPPTPSSLAVEFSNGADADAAFRSRIPGKPEGLPSELADSVIRAFSLAHEAGIDLDRAIHDKMEYNRSRGHRHGGKKF